MATVKYDLNPGQNLTQVVQSAGIAIPSGAGMELTVDTTQFTKKRDLVLALEQLTNYISETAFPL